MSRKKRKTQDETDGVKTLDAFQNLLARIGFGAPNLMEATQYPLTRLTRDYNLMNSLYRSHWLVRKIIDTIPGDMCKNWVTLNCQVAPELLDRFQKVERKTQVKAKILEALKWGRLYGGAAAVMMIAGHEDYLDQPLNLDWVMPGSFKGLLVLDRWAGISPGATQIEDINSPDFGLPEYYRVTTETGRYFDVHSSRVLRFLGRELPYWEKQAEVHWGVSEVEVVFDELKKRDNTSWNIAGLIFLANIRVLKMSKLAEVLAIQNQKAQQALYNTLQAQNWLMSNMGMMVLNADDSYEHHEITGFQGLSNIYESFMLDLSGACEIPITKLFGRSPAGMNATGESDLQNYYDSIEQKQESHLAPQLDKLYPVMALSTWGHIPDDLDYTFNPPQTMPSDKLAELAGKKTSAVVEAYNSGLISQKTGMKELRQMQDETGMYSNITDEDIEAADASVQQQGELFGGIDPEEGGFIP